MFFWDSIETYYFTKTLILILATNLKHSIPQHNKHRKGKHHLSVSHISPVSKKFTTSDFIYI